MNILSEGIHTTKKNTEALVIVSKEIDLDVNAEKTKHMVISRDKNVRQNSNIKTGNKSFERVEQLKYLRTITYQYFTN